MDVIFIKSLDGIGKCVNYIVWIVDFLKKFKEMNINFLIIFFNRNCIGIFKFIVEVKINFWCL